MKFYIKIFIIIFLISLIIENVIKFIASQYCEAMSYFCFLISPIVTLIISAVISLFNIFFSNSKFILRLILLYSISTILASFIYDFFPYRYLGVGSVNINFGVLNKLLSILYIFGALISGLYFYYFKPMIKDLIYLIFYFFSGIIIMHFKFNSFFINIF